MKSAKIFDSLIWVLFLVGTAAALTANGCVTETGMPGSGEDVQDPTPTGVPEATGDNVMTVTVNGSLCSGTPSSQYANEPCVSVTLCPAGSSDPSTCHTINNVLLDTGSYGLRLYKSLVPVATTPVAVAGGALAECVQFGDGSSEWGEVATVGLRLGGQPTIQVPIMLIDANYANPPGPCTAAQSSPDTGPAQTGFNGILGVGLFTPDCGSGCESDANNGEYYACSGSHCSPSAATLDQQVQNPVGLLPRDNNGVILKLPSVPAGGAASLEGQLILGIGTQPNNMPGDVAIYGADENANFTTLFSDYSSTAITSFIDSGSSVLFFPPPTNGTLPDCNSVSGGSHGTNYAGFYCPSATQDLSATNFSSSTAVNGNNAFQVSNAYQLLGTTNKVFATMADSSGIGGAAVFDWGLPFFYGKDVYVGIDGKKTTFGSKVSSGPFWAY